MPTDHVGLGRWSPGRDGRRTASLDRPTSCPGTRPAVMAPAARTGSSAAASATGTATTVRRGPPAGPAPLRWVPPAGPFLPVDATVLGVGVRVAEGRGSGGGATSVSAAQPIACWAPAGRQMGGGRLGVPARSRRDRVRSSTVGGPAPASDSDGRARQPHGHVCVHEGFSLGWRLRAQPPPATRTGIGPVERAGGPRRSGTPTWALGSRVGEAPPRSATCLREWSVGREAGLVGAGHPPHGLRRENPDERDKPRRRAGSERCCRRVAARARRRSGGSPACDRRARLGARRAVPDRRRRARVSAGRGGCGGSGSGVSGGSGGIGGQRSGSRARVSERLEAGHRLAGLDIDERRRGDRCSARLQGQPGARPAADEVDSGCEGVRLAAARVRAAAPRRCGCSRGGRMGLVWPVRRRDGRGEGGGVPGRFRRGGRQLRRRGRCRHGSNRGSRSGFGNCGVGERGDRTDHGTERLGDRRYRLDHRTECLDDRRYRTADGTRGSDHG